MKDVFVSVESDLDETLKQNELLKDRLLEASFAEDIKNLVITSCVEIRNKDLHDETKRISKESKDVSNKSKTADVTYKDLFESVQRSSVETSHCDEVKVKVNFDEIETKNIELEHRVVSLVKENEHLKLTYQSLFGSIKKSRVQTKTSNVTQNEAENLKS
uniref:Pyruvate, phosphate dikinase regulatory protein, chloroplastic n=1 Tax=Tanacetum cinerariifolium TaxID=118510 RepID=A0A6L2K5X4_TANCI|nr:pyruvate, phosphate dikinase regulatory protein, chloroplastic [Tanacetum cinerariifolium]